MTSSLVKLACQAYNQAWIDAAPSHTAPGELEPIAMTAAASVIVASCANLLKMRADGYATFAKREDIDPESASLARRKAFDADFWASEILMLLDDDGPLPRNAGDVAMDVLSRMVVSGN